MSRTATTESGRRRRLALAATAVFFAGAIADTAGTASTPTATTGTGTGTSTTNTGTILVTGTSLPELVTETEPCAVLCYNAACLDSGCAPGDFGCVCGNPHSLVVKMGLCVGTDCDDARQFDSGEWIADVCSAYDKGPGSAALADASSRIVAEIASAAATATDNPVPSTATISNGSGETASTTATTASSSSPTSAASAMRLGLVGGSAGGSVFGRTLAVVGLAGGAAVFVAGML